MLPQSAILSLRLKLKYKMSNILQHIKRCKRSRAKPELELQQETFCFETTMLLNLCG